MRSTGGTLAMAALVLGVCILPAPALAQLYRYTDDSGAVHLVDDVNQLPPHVRGRVEQVMPGKGGPGAARVGPAPGPGAPRPAAGARQDRWRGRSLGEWQGDLRDSSPRVRAEAISALAFFGAPAVPALTAALRDPDAQSRVGAARSLGHIGPEAADAVTALTQALRDGDARVRFDAAVALGRIGPPARDAVPALGRALRDPAGEVRVGAALGLAGMGPAAQEMVPPLADALRDSNAVLRMSAASALGSIGPAAKPAVPALIVALRDSNTSVRTNAAGALGNIGPGARDAVPDLRRLAESERAQDFESGPRDGVLRQKEGALRQELRSTAREALRQIEGR